MNAHNVKFEKVKLYKRLKIKECVIIIPATIIIAGSAVASKLIARP